MVKKHILNQDCELARTVNANDFWPRLVKNITTCLWGSGGANLLNLVTLLLMVKLLGSTNYGLFVLAQQYMTLADSLVNFQSWQGVIKFGSAAVVDGDDERLAAVIKYGFTIDLAGAVAGLALALAAIPVVGRLLQWEPGLLWLAVLFSLEILFHIGGTPTGVLRLFNLYNLAALHSVALAMVRLAAVGIYALAGQITLESLVLLYIGVDIAKHISLLAIAAWVVSRRLGLRRVAKSKLGGTGEGFLRYTLWSNLGSTADIPVKYFDVFIIARLSVELVAIYKVFKQIIQLFSLLANPISQAILPQLAELVARQQDAQAYRVVLRLRNILLALLLPVTVLCSLVAGPCFQILLGPEFAQQVVLFIVLLLANDYTLSYVALHPFFAALGRVREDFMITLGSNIAFLAVAFWLVNYFSIYGIVAGGLLQGVLTITCKTRIIQRILRQATCCAC